VSSAGNRHRKDLSASVRYKFNTAYFTSRPVIATAVGVATEPWPLFVITLIVLLTSNVYLCEIRPRCIGNRRRGGS
jgi:hypothetical protein